MKKMIFMFAATILTSHAYAFVPYCSGEEVTGSKSQALQQVIQEFANENGCVLNQTNCIHNFDEVKYHISWGEYCDNSARRGNDPKGSTFICEDGACFPYGFYFPRANY